MWNVPPHLFEHLFGSGWDEYLLWLFLPIIIMFVLPVFLVLFIYGCVIFLHIYGLRHQIREAYHTSYWNGARIAITSFWDAVGYVWHGYELRGIENVPDEGSALFIYYHGCLPLDVYYLIAKLILHKNRSLHCVGDKFIFKIPGVREALFSDPNVYDIMWGKRLGFARVVIGSRTPVIPMFTENCRESFRTPEWGRSFFRWIYEKTKIPLCPIYGGFPVKMITYLGKPMTFDFDSITPEEVRRQIKREVRSLIREHQRLPGSILRGIAQRFHSRREESQNVEEIDDSTCYSSTFIPPHAHTQDGLCDLSRSSLIDYYCGDHCNDSRDESVMITKKREQNKVAAAKYRNKQKAKYFLFSCIASICITQDSVNNATCRKEPRSTLKSLYQNSFELYNKEYICIECFFGKCPPGFTCLQDDNCCKHGDIILPREFDYCSHFYSSFSYFYLKHVLAESCEDFLDQCKSVICDHIDFVDFARANCAKTCNMCFENSTLPPSNESATI
uniref:ShKT domain-containing protein n=1 Tax=Heterorhabditis bacteriophora TaxID=37862 RepID=A0A1I7WMV8_HETBA